jgi:hypothetical protein
MKIATKLAIVLIIITLGEKLSAQQTEVTIGCIVRVFAFVVNRTKALVQAISTSLRADKSQICLYRK